MNMEAKGSYARFEKKMADFAAEYLGPVQKARRNGEVLQRTTDAAFESVFYGFTEISEAIDALNLLGDLVVTASPRSKRIDKAQYLKLLIGAYLQEIYILEQRITAYGKKISRLYKFNELPDYTHQLVYKPLQPIIETRGGHVHVKRFSDKDLSFLSTLALFRRVGHEFGNDFEFEFKVARESWAKRIKKNNSETIDLIDRFFGILLVTMCSDGKIYLPDRSSKTVREA